MLTKAAIIDLISTTRIPMYTVEERAIAPKPLRA